MNQILNYPNIVQFKKNSDCTKHPSLVQKISQIKLKHPSFDLIFLTDHWQKPLKCIDIKKIALQHNFRSWTWMFLKSNFNINKLFIMCLILESCLKVSSQVRVNSILSLRTLEQK
ncbi:hypothetical protein BpHYR1_018233 [Brachionus plicatilis]|uniref:Uncharacterized protein n=1 Tax=Brachionus plicatilis TaxID=10195 RepID=A0A3M7QWH5_BRAPC|nr:hypothetical protein BpHYR1_018233 [Brachionus plicatilis]